ncbi:unnamed protein product [Orchesella dallaii]|uniref:C2H2-type domain-containing protein n=1 Tax=Orchesella dallaii TaxID=48710 RepID=A0ABP1PV15_9HEXA
MASDCQRHFNEEVEIMMNDWLNDETGEGETVGVNMTQGKPGIVLSNKATFTMTSRQDMDTLSTQQRSSELAISFGTSNPTYDESKSQPMFANGVSFESWILGGGLYKYGVWKMGLHKIRCQEFPSVCMSSMHKTYKCPSGIKYHAKYGHSAYVCDIDNCNEGYSTKNRLAAHKLTHIQNFSASRAKINILSAGSVNIGFAPSTAAHQKCHHLK